MAKMTKAELQQKLEEEIYRNMMFATDIHNLKTQLDVRKNDINSLNEKINNYHRENTRLKSELESSTAQVNAMELRNNELEKEILILKERVGRYYSMFDRLNDEFADFNF